MVSSRDALIPSSVVTTDPTETKTLARLEMIEIETRVSFNLFFFFSFCTNKD